MLKLAWSLLGWLLLAGGDCGATAVARKHAGAPLSAAHDANMAVAASARSRALLAAGTPTLQAGKCTLGGGSCKLNVYYLYSLGMPKKITAGQRCVADCRVVACIRSRQDSPITAQCNMRIVPSIFEDDEHLT
jgi:hypothetical protein